MCKLTEVQQRYIDDLKAAHAAGFCIMYRPSQHSCYVQVSEPTWSNHPDCYRMDPVDRVKWEQYKRDRDCCTEQKTKPHPHAALIKAWADGAAIEFKGGCGDWRTVPPVPCWDVETQYRIKPEQTDLEKYGVEVGDVWVSHHGNGRVTVAKLHNCGCMFFSLNGNLMELEGSDTLMFRRGVVNKL